MIAETSAHSSEQYLHAIAENLEEGVVLADLDGKIVFLNQAAVSILGFSGPEEYLRLLPELVDIFDVCLPNGTSLPVDQWPLARVLAGENLSGLELLIKNLRMGWSRTLSFRGACVRSDDHPPLAVLTMTDLTGRLHREAHFRALIEHSSDSIALISADNKILYLSPSVTAVEGYLPEELIGRSGIENTHPDDLPVIRDLIDKLLANPGKAMPVLWRRRHKKGYWLWLEGFATNLLDEPAVGAIVTNYRNVSGRVRHEEKIRSQLGHLALLDQITRAIAEHQDLKSILRVAVSSLEDGLPIDFGCVLSHDPVGKKLQLNCLGRKSEVHAAAAGLHEHTLIDIDQNGLASCLKGQLVYEPDSTEVLFPFPAALAHAGFNSIVMAPLKADTEVLGLLVVARRAFDGFSSSECEFMRQLSEHLALSAKQTQLYTALQNAYEELHQTQAAMMQEERLRVLGQMASGIAHDINNALTPMLLYTEMLVETEPGLSQETGNHLRTIMRLINDVSQTVSRMRDFSRPQDPSAPVAPVQLNQLAQHVIDLVQVRWRDIPQRQGVVITIKTTLAPGLPTVMGVESEIREALANLMINAVDAMPAGGTLTVTTRAAGTRTAPLVIIEVTDTGVGMDAQTRQRCLEPFFTTKGTQGTGLGLPMVFGMAQRHSANFEIDSFPNEGTTMRLLFPMADPRNQYVAPTAVVELPRPARLLLVDDDPILLASLTDVLTADGHTVVATNNGHEALKLFREALGSTRPFAAVITDLGMPNMDGRQVASAVKMLDAGTPVLLLTGWGQRLMDDGDLPPYISRVLAKPVKLQVLRKALIEVFATPANKSGPDSTLSQHPT
ncbi:MAG: PAS domain S-box protein [Pseudomonadota bacterium]